MDADPVVFVVDDDAAVRDSLRLLLESDGHTVQTFDSAEGFLGALGRTSRGCLLVDVRLPGLDGLELQSRLAANRIGLPVIVMTGYGDVPLAVRAMKAGAIDFIEKPGAEEAVLAAVRRGLAAARATTRKDESQAEAMARIDRLTPREREVFARLAAGRPNKVVAYELDISPRTVEIHRARLMEKIGARSLAELVRLALAAGIEPSQGRPGTDT